MEIKILNREEFIKLIPSYIRLNNKIFNLKVDEEYFTWRYLNNPDEDLLVCAAIDKGEVVANYSATSFYLKNKNKLTLKSAQSLNTMTDPDYQGQGLFMKTAKTLYDEMEKRGYDLIWGFPNNLSHWIFNNKLSWRDIYEYPTLSLKVDDKKIPHENNHIQAVDKNNIDSLLFSKYFTDESYQIDKSRRYLKWRYLDNPVNSYLFYYNDSITENGTYDYMILKKYDNKLNIVELESESSEVIRRFLDFAYKLAVSYGLEYITIWSSINSVQYSIIESYGFWLDMPIFHLGARFFNFKNTRDFKWNISQGDNNIF